MKKSILLIIITLIISTLHAQKAEFYLGGNSIYMPKSISETKTMFSDITSYYGKDTVNVQRSYRQLTYDSLTFKNKFGLNAGIRFQRPLKNKLALAYGLGINYLAFSQSNQEGYNIETLKTDTVKNVNISGQYTYTFSNGLNNTTHFENKINYSIFELQVPILLRYSFSEDVLFNVGINFNVPFATKATREGIRYYDKPGATLLETRGSEKVVTINRNPSTIKRASADVTLEYQKWFNHFGMAIAAKYRLTNFWDINKGEIRNNLIVFQNTYSEEFIKKHSVHPIFVELKAMYRL